MEDPVRLRSEVFDNARIPVDRAVAFEYVPFEKGKGMRTGEPDNLPKFNTVRLHRVQEKELFQAVFCVSSARRCSISDLTV
jgi:hypothetical protein